MNIKLNKKQTEKNAERVNQATRDNEIKFIISNSRSEQILSWLRTVCEPDISFPAATVSSIYYDTREWKYLQEKINSDYLKTKIRVRWYSDLNNCNHSENSYLEVKFKIGSKREKIRLKNSHSGKELATMPLENPEFINIPLPLKGLDLDIPYPLLPALQISYRRERFIDPMSGSRICFDYDISAPRTNNLMIQQTNHHFLDTAVFEIKGEQEELPQSLYPLTDMGLRKSSFSKYLACYLNIKRYML